MAYDKQTWANTAGGNTPLNATRLNHMEDGIEAAYIEFATPFATPTSTDQFMVYRDGATPNHGRIEYADMLQSVPKIAGFLDASLNPDYPAAEPGDMYGITNDGKIGGPSGLDVRTGFFVLCLVANLGGTYASVGTSWLTIDIIKELPVGGTAHAVLSKKTDSNYDVEWATPHLSATIHGATPYYPALSSDEMLLYRNGATPNTAKVTVQTVTDFISDSIGTSVETFTTQTGSYTFVLGDAETLVELDKASGSANFTVPPNSSVAFPVGTRIDLAQYDAGQLIVVEGAGVTVIVTALYTASLRAAGSGATLFKRATDEWYLFGDLEAL